jgi:hypothetical protein
MKMEVVMEMEMEMEMVPTKVCHGFASSAQQRP